MELMDSLVLLEARLTIGEGKIVAPAQHPVIGSSPDMGHHAGLCL